MRGLLLSVLLVLCFQAQAKQMVLIQGYLSNSSSWMNSQVVQLLVQNNWSYSGEYYLTSNGPQLSYGSANRPLANQFYLVNLPTEAALPVQAYYLTAYLKHIRQRYPEDRLILVGHSAGGVLARYAMVQNPHLNISQLITIASPHLGTESAALGKLLGDSPMALVTPWIGAGTLNRSQGLYQDLLPEAPGRFLYWLNHQPHPEAEYISIVRDQTAENMGELIVEQESQYLEHVYDLKDRAYSYIVPASHSLSSADGMLILDLIEERVLKSL